MGLLIVIVVFFIVNWLLFLGLVGCVDKEIFVFFLVWLVMLIVVVIGWEKCYWCYSVWFNVVVCLLVFVVNVLIIDGNWIMYLLI